MNKLSKLTVIALVTISSLSFASRAKANNKFDVCLRELTTSGVATEEAQIGCAEALNPKDLSYCVSTIADSTAIDATDALKNCFQVRRPVELGNCVVSIQNEVLSATTEKSSNKLKKPSPVMMALNTCRASLLPDRHSQCVVALSRTPEVSSPIQAMETCISAEDFPPELFPMN